MTISLHHGEAPTGRPAYGGSTTVLVVDDQVLIRAGLAALVRAAPGLDVVGEAATGEEAVDLAATTCPDVILMDIRLPGISGITAMSRILAHAPAPAPKVLMLTVIDLDEYVYEALRTGASGFLLKDTPPDQLLTAIGTVAAGQMLLDPVLTRRLVETFVHQPHTPGTVPDPSRLRVLTSREKEVLRLVARGLTNEEIADHLVVTMATVKTHVNRLLSKLALGSRAQAVVLAYECGLVAVGDGGPPMGIPRPPAR
ncbi:response regulator [Kitasatospora sp. NPDC096147]|uniref:response regulator n=1 Tax=Kitasatospora sp. NPDC096147 TaxID=3364093 RepID=UPI003812E7A7